KGTSNITIAGLADCMFSAVIWSPKNQPRALFQKPVNGMKTILFPCSTQVEFDWSNKAQKAGINAKMERIGPTDLAASTSSFVNLLRATSQNFCPGFL